MFSAAMRSPVYQRWASLEPTGDGTQIYRPRGVEHPWIILFDGGGLPGRIEPLTDGKLRIGREQGDLRFAHDMLISSRHAE
ncbi:MAG: hypothetical protein ACRDD1_05775, partial [Planctomycetia bacterium]